jgi:hypothetical protein
MLECADDVLQCHTLLCCAVLVLPAGAESGSGRHLALTRAIFMSGTWHHTSQSPCSRGCSAAVERYVTALPLRKCFLHVRHVGWSALMLLLLGGLLTCQLLACYGLLYWSGSTAARFVCCGEGTHFHSAFWHAWQIKRLQTRETGRFALVTAGIAAMSATAHCVGAVLLGCAGGRGDDRS